VSTLIEGLAVSAPRRRVARRGGLLSASAPLALAPASEGARTRRYLLAALLLIVLTSWFSIGFHHYDEHFQLLEYANYKLGRTPVADLPWEFQARIRSWFQPAVAFAVVSGLEGAGVSNPFYSAAVLRLLSGLLFWLALVRLVRVSRWWFDSPAVRRAAIAAVCLLWFMPFLAVRFSSESWAGSLFIIGFSYLVAEVYRDRASGWDLGWAGVALGLAVLARYQALILVLAGILWFLREARPGFARLAPPAAGFGVALGAGLLLDRWGYGEWGFTPLRYLIAVHPLDAVGRFGSSPWWWYFPRTLWSGVLPIALPLLVGAVAAWVRRPRSPLTWISLPFVAVHCLIAHKELRFLFPLAPVLPFLAFQGLEALPALARQAVASPRARLGWWMLAGINAAALVLRCLLPAYQTIGLQRAIYDSAPHRLLIADGEDPYALGGLRVESHFYRPSGLVLANLTDAGGDIVAEELQSPSLVVWSGVFPFDASRIACRPIYQSEPDWSRWEPLHTLLAWARSDRWTLARCWPVESGG